MCAYGVSYRLPAALQAFLLCCAALGVHVRVGLRLVEAQALAPPASGLCPGVARWPGPCCAARAFLTDGEPARAVAGAVLSTGSREAFPGPRTGGWGVAGVLGWT